MKETEAKLQASREEVESLQEKQKEHLQQNKQLEAEVESLKKDMKDMNVQLTDDVRVHFTHEE